MSKDAFKGEFHTTSQRAGRTLECAVAAMKKALDEDKTRLELVIIPHEELERYKKALKQIMVAAHQESYRHSEVQAFVKDIKKMAQVALKPKTKE
jgi:hypothetical protein